jgi:hypothetical protein
MAFTTKSADKIDADRSAALEDYDLACEAAYFSALKIRGCPYCDEGWRSVWQYSEFYGKEHEFVERCDCWYEFAQDLRRMRAAKAAYLKRFDVEPPEPDYVKLRLW